MKGWVNALAKYFGVCGKPNGGVVAGEHCGATTQVVGIRGGGLLTVTCTIGEHTHVWRFTERTVLAARAAMMLAYSRGDIPWSDLGRCELMIRRLMEEA